MKESESEMANSNNKGDAVNQDPFFGMKISPLEPLEGLRRSKCPKCQASRKYFCYTCYCFMEEGVPEGAFPATTLPIKIDIIKHPNETDGKSTAVHAAVIASQDVKLYTYPSIPDYTKEKDNILLLFPGPHSKPMDYYIKSTPKTSAGDKRKISSDDCTVKGKTPKMSTSTESLVENETSETILQIPSSVSASKLIANFDKVVMIDSTWNQSYSIFKDERLKGLKCVELVSQKTNYWRKQYNKPDTYLATIEALYLFVKTYHETFLGKYEGQYDDLLFFFKFFYNMVKKSKSKKKVIKNSS